MRGGRMRIPRVREWREARALTQVELAVKAGVSPRSIASYEAGGGARLPMVRRVADALEVEVTDLMADDGVGGGARGRDVRGVVNLDEAENVIRTFLTWAAEQYPLANADDLQEAADEFLDERDEGRAS